MSLRNDPILVTVIMTTFNRCEWLPSSVGSVLSQSYQNWEMIIVDDGSTDGTSEYIHSVNDSRIRAIHTKNYGKSHALNTAITEAKGELIALIDDDDIWHIDKLEKQIAIFQQNLNIDLVITDYINIDHKNQIDRRQEGFANSSDVFKYLHLRPLSEKVFTIENGFLDAMAYSNFILYSSAMIKKDAIELVGHFNETLQSAIDSEYWWRLGLTKPKVAVIFDNLVTRNWLPESLCRPSIDHYQNRIRCVEICISTIPLNGSKVLIQRLAKQKAHFLKRILREYSLINDWKSSIKLISSSPTLILSLRAWSLMFGAFLPKSIQKMILRRP